jgi:hypothetical protein
VRGAQWFDEIDALIAALDRELGAERDGAGQGVAQRASRTRRGGAHRAAQCRVRRGEGGTMLLYLTEILRHLHSGFNVFSYLTMRSILSALTALAISLLVGPTMIRHLSHYQIGQTVRTDGPSSHLDKAGTPTMGGALILVAVAISTLLWASLSNRFVWVVLGLTIAFGLIGFIDDYRKLVLRDSKGLAARWKYLLQSLAASVARLRYI